MKALLEISGRAAARFLTVKPETRPVEGRVFQSQALIFATSDLSLGPAGSIQTALLPELNPPVPLASGVLPLVWAVRASLYTVSRAPMAGAGCAQRHREPGVRPRCGGHCCGAGVLGHSGLDLGEQT